MIGLGMQPSPARGDFVALMKLIMAAINGDQAVKDIVAAIEQFDKREAECEKRCAELNKAVADKAAVAEESAAVAYRRADEYKEKAEADIAVAKAAFVDEVRKTKAALDKLAAELAAKESELKAERVKLTEAQNEFVAFVEETKARHVEALAVKREFEEKKARLEKALG